MRKFILIISLCLNVIMLAPYALDLTYEMIYHREYKAQREAYENYKEHIKANYPVLDRWWLHGLVDTIYYHRIDQPICEAAVKLSKERGK